MVAEFQPKGAEVLRQEIVAELGIDYEGNEEMVDKMVARDLKGEEFKASVHSQKKEHQAKSQKREELLKQLGVNPETGDKIVANDPKPANDSPSIRDRILEGKALSQLHEDDAVEVAKYAQDNNIPLHEAIKRPFVQSFLRTQTEERATANATNTNTTKHSTKADDESIVQDFHKGIVSESQEDIDKLVLAEETLKRKQNKTR